MVNYAPTLTELSLRVGFSIRTLAALARFAGLGIHVRMRSEGATQRSHELLHWGWPVAR